MNTEFCMECGTRYEYSLKKPNYCAGCGCKLNEVASATQTDAPSVVEEVEPEKGTPQISKLEYEIQRGPTNLTFGDLVSQAAQDPNDEYVKMESRPRPPKSNNDIQQQVLSECQSARGSQKVSE